MSQNCNGIYCWNRSFRLILMSALSTPLLLQYGQQSAQRTHCIDLYSPQYPTCNARCVKPHKIIKICWTYHKFTFLISLACILISFPGVDICSIVGTYSDENCAPHASFQSYIAEIVYVQYSVVFSIYSNHVFIDANADKMTSRQRCLKLARAILNYLSVFYH